jgi:hypothetical protein
MEMYVFSPNFLQCHAVEFSFSVTSFNLYPLLYGFAREYIG